MKLLELFSVINEDERLARAKALGYNTDKIWYHANTGGIEGEGFDDARLPEHDPDRPFNAHWFSSEPSEFAAYPSTGNTITPVHLKLDPSKEATNDVWRKVAREVYQMYRKGEAPKGKRPADLIREKLVDMGYTHAVRGREPIDAEELKRTGQTSFKTSTGGTITLKWEKVKAPPQPPQYTEEEIEAIRAYQQAQEDMNRFHTLVIDVVSDGDITPEQREKIHQKAEDINARLKKYEPLATAAENRAYAEAQKKAGEFDSLEMYDDDIGHVTGYSSLEDFEQSHPEQEDIAVLDPSIIRSVHADFRDDKSRNMMASIGEAQDERLARARAMGFDTNTVWYHGTAEPDIHSFQGYRGVAGHFTTDPGWARDFADSALGNIKDNMDPEEFATDPAAEVLYPVFLRLKNVFDLRNPQHRAMIGMDPEKQVYIDYTTLEDSIKEIKAAGFDGYIDYEQPEDDDGSVAVFDPKNIRSIYAKFEDGNSSNIMASIGESQLVEVRGPHEGKEFELMMAGKKPLAMDELRQPYMTDEEIAKWKKAIADGRIIHRPGTTFTANQNKGRHKTDFFALPGEEWRLDAIQELYDDVQRRQEMTDEHHIALGRLLGYSDADIRHFVTGREDALQQSWENNFKPRMGEAVNEPRTPEVAYHATHPENRDSIRLHGLDPKYSQAFEDGGAVFFATGGKPDPKMDIWKVNLRGLPVEYDNTQVTGEPGWGENEHWWYTDVHVVPDRLTLVQKGDAGYLGEAPIRDFDVHPSSQTARNTWNPRDQKRVAKPEYEALARKRIKTAVPIDVTIMGLDEDWMDDEFASIRFENALDDYSGIMTPDRFEAEFDMRIEPASDALTAVFISNTNDASSAMPFSPWIMCHRMAHSLFDAATKHHLSDKSFQNAYPFMDIPTHFLTMKSAAPGKRWANQGEKGVEAMAQFLHNGEIKLARPVGVEENGAVAVLNNGHRVPIGSQFDSPEILKDELQGLIMEIEDLEEQLNVSATIIVNECIGSILVAP